jgi:hypothetical protein
LRRTHDSVYISSSRIPPINVVLCIRFLFGLAPRSILPLYFFGKAIM